MTEKQIIAQMGYTWSDTESSARRVAEYCAKIISAYEEEVKLLKEKIEHLEYGGENL